MHNPNSPSKLRSYLRLQYAITSEHGSWVFLLSPLLIGLFIGDTFTFASFFLVIAVLAAFLIRQPVTIAVKAYSGRRSRADLPGARFWILVYGWMETIYGTLRPAVGYKPTRIGIRQLIISTLFTLCFILSWIAT